MKRTLLFVSFAFLLTSLTAAEKNDWLLIPESRIGPITTSWTGADIVRAFGAANARKTEFPGEWEGDPARKGFLLFPGTNDEIEIFIGSDGTVESAAISAPLKIEDDGARAGERKTHWRSISGITLGSTPAEVEKVNGKSFDITGWETENAGGCDWKGGKIPESFQVNFWYRDSKVYEKIWNAVLSEKRVWDENSRGDIMKELDIIVTTIKVKL